MKIDLFYYTPYLNDYYFVYGPEKDTNGDIYIKGTGYYFADVNDMKAKLNSMTASLAPEITNVQARTQGNSFWIYVGDLNTSSSDVPDYTDVLTSINTNLTNLNSKLTFDNTSICKALIRIFDCINIGQVSSSQSSIKTNSYIRFLTALSAFGLGSDDVGISDNSNFKNIWRTLRKSASPNSNITDVISALNTNIHNDLTDINTTTNNKDTVLIIDGQQEFKLHKDDE